MVHRSVPRTERAAAGTEAVELAAAGTDDGLATTLTSSDAAASPELWLAGEAGAGPQVFSCQPDLRALRPSLWRVALLGAGSALTLSGLLYPAWAATPLVAGRF